MNKIAIDTSKYSGCAVQCSLQPAWTRALQATSMAVSHCMLVEVDILGSLLNLAYSQCMAAVTAISFERDPFKAIALTASNDLPLLTGQPDDRPLRKSCSGQIVDKRYSWDSAFSAQLTVRL